MTSATAPAATEMDTDLDTKAELEMLEYAGTRQVDYSGVADKTDPAEIALVRRLDFVILPMLWIMYFCNFMDRNAVTNAKLDNLSKDLGLHGSEYNTAISILFVGYLLGQIPSNMILTRVRPSWYMASFMMLWAVVSGLTAAVHNYTGLVLIRFFLGIVEAPFYPGALYMLSIFYTKKELSLRIALFYTGNISANAFSGLIAAAVFATLDGTHGLEGWRWLFIITGVVTFGCALVGFFILPDNPGQTWWLSAEQRELAVERIKRDTTEESGTTSMMNGLKQACGDYRTWLFCFMMNMHVSGDSFKNFFPSMIKTLGFDTTITLVLTCPPYVASLVVSPLLCWSSGRFNERTWHIIGATGAVITGFIIAASTTNIAARYVGVVIFVSMSSGVNDIMLGWAASTLGQTPEKRAVAMAMVNMLSNVSSVYTPYLWNDSTAPRYIPGMASCAAFSVMVVVSTYVIMIVLKRDNVRIRQSAPETTVLYAY
ncbi:MFS transporter [Myxozyma melibiosi]|uniref:MFS transporter n=1 Tax=Myxozyma melibiosi TaxID=54550 RepID=A0ABR1F4Y7_9ASCO